MVQGAINRRHSGLAVPPFDALADPRKWCILIDDFVVAENIPAALRSAAAAATTATHALIDDARNVFGSLGWNLTHITGTTATLAAHATAAQVQGHPGILRLSTLNGTEAMVSFQNLDAFI